MQYNIEVVKAFQSLFFFLFLHLPSCIKYKWIIQNEQICSKTCTNTDTNRRTTIIIIFIYFFNLVKKGSYGIQLRLEACMRTGIPGTGHTRGRFSVSYSFVLSSWSELQWFRFGFYKTIDQLNSLENVVGRYKER